MSHKHQSANDLQQSGHKFSADGAKRPGVRSDAATPPETGRRTIPPKSALPAQPKRSRLRRVGTLPRVAPDAAIAAQITARASGNCEIFSTVCTFQQDAIFFRRRRANLTSLATAADALAACSECIGLIEYSGLPSALDLGYIVDPRSCTTTVALLWRQHRWVYLDTHGRMHDQVMARQTQAV